MTSMIIRDAEPGRDAAACAGIYAAYVRDTAMTFEEEPPTTAVMARRIEAAQERHAWLVGERDGHVVGYAYGGPFKARSAYRYSCEVSVYLGTEHRGRGDGTQLYVALLERLTSRGFRMACAGVTMPNDASVALHRRLGFEPVGTFRRIGWKHGAWRDVAWFQRPLGNETGPPAG